MVHIGIARAARQDFIANNKHCGCGVWHWPLLAWLHVPV
jgi:hypothetical protein